MRSSAEEGGLRVPIVNSNQKREGSNQDWKGEIGVREEEQSTGASSEESQ